LVAFDGVSRGDAQGLPQLAQSPQNGSFGQLTAQTFSRFCGGHHSVFVQSLPQLEHQRRDFVSCGFLRRVLPIGIPAQRQHERQRILMSEKIGLLADGPKQVQGDHVAGGDQARQQAPCLFNGGSRRCGMTAAHAGFDKRRRRRRQLGVAGQKEAQGMLAAPFLCVIESKEGAFVLAPVRRPCCLELFCYQEGPFSRGSV
jgi:hypothetical protein